MKYYLCKFIPPRADFLATMSADEREWMKQHGVYLNGLLDRGLVAAHGPRDGPLWRIWRIALSNRRDDQDVSALTSEDPIIKNGAGHYEHHPMLHLKTRS